MRLYPGELTAIREHSIERNYNVYSIEPNAVDDLPLFNISAYTIPGMLSQLPMQIALYLMKQDPQFNIAVHDITVEHSYVGEDRWLFGATIWNKVAVTAKYLECIIVQED